MSKNKPDDFDSQEFDPAPVHPLANSELNPEQWVELFITSNSISYDYKTSSIWQGGELLDLKLLLSKMRLATYKYDVPHLRQFLKDALSVWMKAKAKDHLNVLRSKLKFTPSSNDLIEQWVVAVTGKADSCDVAMTRHFIWQVKRKLYSLPVEHHALVCIFGASGAGKSVAVQKLLEPISSVTIHQNMTVFNDQFSRRMFTSNYCMVFDEMGKSKQVDIDCLKNIITANTVEWRGIQSESIHSGLQNCTFLAASNILYETESRIRQVPDGSGSSTALKKLNWEEINNIDYLSLWRSIDERCSCPILNKLTEIHAIQNNDLRAHDPIEEWIHYCCQKSQSDKETLTTSELYLKYREWSAQFERAEKISLQKFSRAFPDKLQAIFPEIQSTHSHNGTVWPLTVVGLLNQAA